MPRHPDDPRGNARPTAPPPLKPIPEQFARIADDYADGVTEEVHGLVFWKIRHHFPDMGVLIEARDIDQFFAALAYNEQRPRISVMATHAGVAVRLVDVTTGDPIIPQESEQAELDKALAAKRLDQIRSSAPGLVNNLRMEVSSGTMSNSTIESVCNALLMLAAR